MGTLIERLGKHPAWIAFAGFCALLAALVAFLNGLPQLFDQTFPWLRDRVSPLGVTIEQILALAVAAASLVIQVLVLVRARPVQPASDATSHPPKGAQGRKTASPSRSAQIDALQTRVNDLQRAVDRARCWRIEDVYLNESDIAASYAPYFGAKFVVEGVVRGKRAPDCIEIDLPDHSTGTLRFDEPAPELARGLTVTVTGFLRDYRPAPWYAYLFEHCRLDRAETKG